LRREDYRLIEHRLRYIAGAHKIYEKVQLADAVTGVILASTDDRDVGNDSSHEQYFVSAKHLPQDISVNVKDSPSDGKSRVVLSGLMLDSSSPASAVIILFVDNASFSKSMLYTGSALGETGEVVLVNRQGTVLAPLNYPRAEGSAPQVLRNQVRISPGAPKDMRETKSFRATDYRGVQVLGAYRDIDINPDMSWEVLVKIDQTEVFAPLWHRVWQTLVLSLIGLLGAGGLAAWNAKAISQPIEDLDRVAQQVNSGDLSARAPVQGPRELQSLASTLNAMIKDVQDRQQALDLHVKAQADRLTKLDDQLAAEIAQCEQMENQLVSQKRLAQAMLHTIGDCFITTDVSGRVVSMNSVAEQVTGWQESEAVGRSLGEVFRLINEETLQPCENAVDKILSSGFVIGLAHPTALIARDGTQRSIADGGTTILDGHGKTVGVLFVFREVTVRGGPILS